MLPDGVADRFGRVFLQGGLREQAGQITGKRIAGTALAKKRVAGGINENVALAAANQGLVSFEHDPGVAEPLRNEAHPLRAIGLDLRRGAFERA